MKKLLIVFMAALMLLTGCAVPAKEAPASLTEKVEVHTPEVNPCSDFSPAAEFSAQLFERALMKEGKNPVISPLSAYICLSMVMNGADADTLKEFESVLGGDTDTVNSLCYALINGLTDTSGSTVMSIADSLWADDDRVSIREDFIQAVADWYSADVFTEDLPSNEALKKINAWVNERTGGLIPYLHTEPYPADTVAVLLNTLYMKAKWQTQFEGFMTRDLPFYREDGSEMNAPFMNEYFTYRQYIESDNARGVLLPYDDGKTAFVALLPTDMSAREYAAALGAEGLNAAVDAAQERLVNLSLPKFDVAYEAYLTDMLEDMGLISVFADSADLTKLGQGADGPLYLSWVFQKVKIKVNEEGTEAAAVTEAAAADGASMMEEEPVELVFDRPFVYAVVDMTTGVPLFMGVLDEPVLD